MAKTIVLLVIAIVLGIGIWQILPERKEAQQPIASNNLEFYEFDYFDAAGEHHSIPNFGTQDRVGVVKAIQDALPGRVADFMFIGDQRAAREQFVTAKGHAFVHPDHIWDARIIEFGTVNGATRLAVIVDVGVLADDPYLIQRNNDLESFGLSEIWELGSGDPVLLDRQDDIHLGLLTHAEAPLPVFEWDDTPMYGGSGEFSMPPDMANGY